MTSRLVAEVLPVRAFTGGRFQAHVDAPVPMGRWCWIAMGRDVSRVWLEAMQQWLRPASPQP